MKKDIIYVFIDFPHIHSIRTNLNVAKSDRTKHRNHLPLCLTLFIRTAPACPPVARLDYLLLSCQKNKINFISRDNFRPNFLLNGMAGGR